MNMLDAAPRWLIVLQCLVHFTGTTEVGYCSFPEFLWQAASGTLNRKWYGRTEFFQNTEFWERHTEVLTKETEIIMREKVYSPCDRGIVPDESTIPCYREDIVMNFICIAEEPQGKYRLQQNIKGELTFSCIQFVKRNENLIQIRKAPSESANEDWLCYDDYLVRDEWPWIAAEVHDWSFCAFSGGFDFTATSFPSKEEKCADEWRPSRLESECTRGDGLSFYFPSQQCNLFHVSRLELNFQCWVSWHEHDFTFVIFGERNKTPRYVLRIPKHGNIYDEFKATLYLSPVTPIAPTGAPQSQLGHIDLELLRSEPGVCYDSSRKCRQLMAEGKCTSSALHQYANFCKKSCGLCQFAGSTHPECHFPPGLQGDWVAFSSLWPGEREQVSVGTGHLRFSSLPTMICKSRHWHQTYYKVYSIFNNGCRPRYSCVDLNEGEGHTINFRLSKSDLTDHSFDLCKFQDDPHPLGGLVRSSTYKLFLPMESMFLGSCGIDGEASVQLKLADGRECSGSVWDVNLNTCEASSHLSIQAPSCSSQQQLEFLCSAVHKLSSNTSFLVTMTSHEDPQYICWVQTERKSTPLVIVHDRVLCETAAKPVLPKHRGDIVSFTVFKDLENKPCGKLNEEPRDEAWSDTHNSGPEAHVAPRVDAAVTPLDPDKALYRSHQSDSHDYVEGRRKTDKKIRSRKKHRHKYRNRTSTEYTGWEVTRVDEVTVIPIQVMLGRSRGNCHRHVCDVTVLILLQVFLWMFHRNSCS